MKITGYSVKASNSPTLTKEALGKSFELIATGKEEDEVFNEIRPLIKQVYDGVHPPSCASSFNSLSKDLDKYEKTINAVTAARCSNQYLGTNYKKNDSVQWVYIDDVPKASRSRM